MIVSSSSQKNLFLNHAKFNRICIVINCTESVINWFGTLWCQINRKSVISIQVWFDSSGFRERFICVSASECALPLVTFIWCRLFHRGRFNASIWRPPFPFPFLPCRDQSFNGSICRPPCPFPLLPCDDQSSWLCSFEIRCGSYFRLKTGNFVHIFMADVRKNIIQFIEQLIDVKTSIYEP